MHLSRRRFLGSSLFVLGNSLLNALTCPIWNWRESLAVQAIPVSKSTPSSVVFVDVAHQAGLNVPNVWGSVDRKRYIVEAKGSGLAFFDYDNDGWLDIYLTNGDRLDTQWTAGTAPLHIFSRTTATVLLPMSPH